MNRQYKDRLFTWLFGREKNRENILELYNVLNGTDYKDAGLLEINTIGNDVYLGMHNDVSFLLGEDMLSFWEEQSTPNPNMPIRGLMHMAQVYNAYVKSRKLNIYGTRRIPLPAPQYIVFYLGKQEEPDRVELRLSDSFPDRGKIDFKPCAEVTAVMLNVNVRHNQKILEGCRVLAEYAELIWIVRENVKSGMEIEDAVSTAVDYCIGHDILTDILKKSRSEVIEMLLTEYDEKIVNEMFKEEGRQEGIAIGEKRGEKRGEDRLSSLYLKLMEVGRMDDAQRVMIDEEFRNMRYKEFHI